ncbi:DUF5610 domain-containing protein [Colwellia sp. MEBiC06753]
MQITTNNVPASKPQITKDTQQLSAFEIAKQQKNRGILAAQLEASTKGLGREAADNPQQLLLKAAINEINQRLEPYLGENAAQKAYESDTDFSPEATAERIVNGATGLFKSFTENNPDLDNEAALNRFNEIITGGIEQGFGEAKDILASLKVLEGEVGDNIDSTYELVFKGLTNFTNTMLEKFKQDAETQESDTSRANGS